MLKDMHNVSKMLDSGVQLSFASCEGFCENWYHTVAASNVNCNFPDSACVLTAIAVPKL